MYFVDTNIFLRVLTKDDTERAERCFALLKKAEAKEIELVTTEAVITEIVYYYNAKCPNAARRARVRLRWETAAA